MLEIAIAVAVFSSAALIGSEIGFIKTHRRLVDLIPGLVARANGEANVAARARYGARN